jgi:hypothetical protein
MALRHLESFEGQRHMTVLARLYDTATGSIAENTGHRSAFCVSSANLLLRTRDLLDGAADENTWIAGWAMRLANSSGLSAAATVFPYLSLRSAAGEQLRVEFVASNESKPGGNGYKLRVMRGATELATSVDRFLGSPTDYSFTYLEFEAVVRTGTNGSFTLRYHTRYQQNIVATWTAANTGINTANQGADGADRVELALTQSPSTDIAVDNIYVCDGTGSVNNAKLGQIHVEALDPTANGATVEWDLQGGAGSLEDAWNEAADVNNATEDDKRVSTKDVGFIELASMSNLAVIRSVTIVGIQTRITGRMEASGTRDVQFFYRKTTGSPAQVGTDIVTFDNTSLISHVDTRETDPNTAAAWVVADVDGVQMGVELDA